MHSEMKAFLINENTYQIHSLYVYPHQLGLLKLSSQADK